MENINIIIEDVISIDPQTLGGTAVFKGTRVPIQTLIDHIQRNIPLEEFLENFPSVKKSQAIKLIKITTTPKLPAQYA